MVNTDFARTLAAIACTIVLSTTCVLGAVAPAQSSAPVSAPISVVRLSA